MLNTHRTESRSNNCPVEELEVTQCFKNQGQVFSIAEKNVHRKYSKSILNFFHIILKLFLEDIIFLNHFTAFTMEM